MTCSSCGKHCISGYIRVERSCRKGFYCYECTARLSKIRAWRQLRRRIRTQDRIEARHAAYIPSADE